VGESETEISSICGGGAAGWCGVICVEMLEGNGEKTEWTVLERKGTRSKSRPVLRY
jgi:hypothetical protein